MADGNITATLKAGRDFDAPWIVVGANTPEELTGLLDRVAQAGTHTAAANAARALQATYAVAATGPVTQVATEATPAPAAAPLQIVPDAPVATFDPETHCKHGARVHKSGTKGNKTWSANFCKLPKGSAGICDPVWV